MPKKSNLDASEKHFDTVTFASTSFKGAGGGPPPNNSQTAALQRLNAKKQLLKKKAKPATPRY